MTVLLRYNDTVCVYDDGAYISIDADGIRKMISAPKDILPTYIIRCKSNKITGRPRGVKNKKKQ